MCLYTLGYIETAEDDIVVYKTMYTTYNDPSTFCSPFRMHKYTIGIPMPPVRLGIGHSKSFSSNSLTVALKPWKAFHVQVDSGYHTFVNLEDAAKEAEEEIIERVGKCIIPKGSLFVRGLWPSTNDGVAYESIASTNLIAVQALPKEKAPN